jgi:hypothetical protein
MSNEVKKEGDYSNIMEYFSRMLSIQQRKEFPLHNYIFIYIKHRIIESADNGVETYSTEYPNKNNIDRIGALYFQVKEENIKFDLMVEWTNFTFSNTPRDFDYNKFIEMIDQSTFRFF